MDLEFIHLFNELLDKYPPSIHLKIIQEMVNMESEELKKKHLQQFFFLKLQTHRMVLKMMFDERSQLPVGKMNKNLCT